MKKRGDKHHSEQTKKFYTWVYQVNGGVQFNVSTKNNVLQILHPLIKYFGGDTNLHSNQYGVGQGHRPEKAVAQGRFALPDKQGFDCKLA